MYTYCLFCEPGRGRAVSQIVHIVLGLKTIYPQQTQHTWAKGGGTRDVIRDLMPGYVFLYSEEKVSIPRIYDMRMGVLRCLSSGQMGGYELTGSDELFALMLLEKNGMIGKTQVYEEGQRIRIKDGAFLGVTATILKVERRLNRMQIEIPFAHRLVRTWVEYEVVEPEKS